ncbi:hypothetical protein G7Y89_g10205 [Cudoniella acicularis]|uniref:Cytochrome P450 n=1 Tax=Cudoniella acicularis TaxID=354080 RepID=A0A8H4RD80_9HELO|nr:hypothetical protein G7Y89_g10205 [Cudoniella acicularis]
MRGSTSLILVAVGAVLIAFICKKVKECLAAVDIERENRCLKPREYPHKDPILGLDLFFMMGKAMRTGKMLETTQKLFDTYGKTFKSNSWGTTVINTCEPRNIQTVLALSFKSFGKVKVQPEKQGGSLMAQGIFTADGPIWARSRALIRPTFARSEISNFSSLEKHVSRFLDLIPRDGSTVDLQPLTKNLFLDISTEFLFGESVESQSPNTSFDSGEFLKAFDASMRGLAARMMLGKLKFIRGRDIEWKKAIKQVHTYIDGHVTRVLKMQRSSGVENSEEKDHPQKQYVLLNEMTKETQDPIDLRYQLLHVFIPAHDATGIAVSDIFFHLARDPNRRDKLRAEVLAATASQPLSFELLKSLKYLRYVFNESLRLHPTAGIVRRICHQDTIFPLGGGPDGQAPILVTRGSNVVLNYHVLHRDKAFWGDDADEFRPERWDKVRPTWEYLPFSGGPRICPAQQMVFTDAAYIIVTVIQKFSRIENQDPLPWTELFRMTVENRNDTSEDFGIGELPLAMVTSTAGRYTGFLSHVTFATERSIVALSASILVLATCAVALRFYVRRVQKAALLIDDWLTLPSLVMIIGMAISMIIGAKRHALGYKTPFPKASLDVIVNYKSPEGTFVQQLWKLHITLGRKIALTGVFLLGAVAVAASAARIGIYVIAVNAGFQPGIDPDVDIADTLY